MNSKWRGIAYTSSLLLLLFLVFPSAHRTCLLLGVEGAFSQDDIKPIPQPKTCLSSKEQPTARSIQIISSQAQDLHLKLQSVGVCRPSGGASSFMSELSAAISESAGREPWLEVYGGCCTYALRRHFGIVIVDGDLVVVASLIQDRLSYLSFLRRHCDRKLAAWL